MPKNREALIIAIAGALSNWPALLCGFAYDDDSAIVRNRDVLGTSQIADVIRNDFWGTPLWSDESHKSYRPVTTLSFRLDHGLWGLNPVAFHTVNILLHVGNCLLLYAFANGLAGGRAVSFRVALLFSVHPIHVEAVTGVVGRAELISAAFVFCAFIVRQWCEALRPCYRAAVWCVIFMCCFLATFAKEQGFCAVILLLVMEVLLVLRYNNLPVLSTRIRWSHFCMDYAAFNCIVIIFTGSVIGALRAIALQGELPRFSNFDNPASAHSDVWVRLRTFVYLPALNFWLLLLPDWMCADWSMGTVPLVHSCFECRFLLAVLFYVSLAVLCVYFCVQTVDDDNVLVFMGLAFLVVPFLPASNLLFHVGFVIAERVLYLPSVGFVILVVHGFNCLLKHVSHGFKNNVLGAFWFVIVVFSAKSMIRSYDWRSDLTLFHSATRVTMNNAKVFNNIGHYLEKSNDTLRALSYFEEATKVQPDDLGAWTNVGRALMALNRPAEALNALLRAKALMPRSIPGKSYTVYVSPTNFNVYVNLGNLYKSLGRFSEAISTLREALTLRPSFIPACLNMADIYSRLNDTQQALITYEECLKRDPLNADVLYNIALMHLKKDPSERSLNIAISKLEHSVGSNPGHWRSFALLSVAHLLKRENGGMPDQRKATVGNAQIAYDLNPTGTVQLISFFALKYHDAAENAIAAALYEIIREASIPAQLPESIWYNLAMVYSELNRHKDAAVLLNEALMFHPGSVRCKMALCDCMFKIDKLQAIDCYADVVSIDSGNAQARHNLCVSLIDIGDKGKSEECLRLARGLVGLSEGYTEVHYNVLVARFRKSFL